jgi:16S rRNA processing protein RimM
MGRVAGSYGVRGWLKVAPGGGAAKVLVEAAKWFIGGEGYEVAEAKVHGATVVAKLAGIEVREEALALRGKPVLIERGALPEPEEGHYYLADLVGLEVVNEQGVALGRVRTFFSNGPQDVMEVAGDKERLMPWVPAVVKDVDLVAKQILVEWGADW